MYFDPIHPPLPPNSPKSHFLPPPMLLFPFLNNPWGPVCAACPPCAGVVCGVGSTYHGPIPKEVDSPSSRG